METYRSMTHPNVKVCTVVTHSPSMHVWFLSYFSCVNGDNSFLFLTSFYAGGQHAVAINVPKYQCQSGFNPQNTPFLINDPPGTVKQYTRPNSVNVYRGCQVIAAGFATNAHSEHLLLNPPNHSPLTHLMNTNRDGCVVFYTLNSPCDQFCLNSNSGRNILQSLVEINAYNGIKAFVFSYIYNNYRNGTNIGTELQKIADRVPLYRCNRDGCILCGRPGSNIPVIDQCLIP